MTSDNAPTSHNAPLPADGLQPRSELATCVNTVIDHENRKALAAVEALCDSTEVGLERFNDLAVRSKLVNEDEWAAFLSANQALDLREWVNRLLAAKLLTAWQIHKLLAGKYKGFVIGNYQVRETLGQGAAGAVYCGQHQTMRRPVALKVLADKVTRDDDSMVIVFERLGMLTDLDHEHVVHYFDVGESNRAVYMVMELITGRTLQQLVRRYGRLPRAVVGEVGRQLLKALDHIHSETGVLSRSAADNIIADSLGQIHVLPLDLTSALSLGLEFDGKSRLAAIETFRNLLCSLDSRNDEDQNDGLDDSRFGNWHRWTDDQIKVVSQSDSPWAELSTWL